MAGVIVREDEHLLTDAGLRRRLDLRDQQRAAAAADPLGRLLSAEGLQVQQDEVHLTRAGYAELARRVARVVR